MENNQENEIDLNQLVRVRREKLENLKKDGKDPYKITKFDRTHTSKDIIENYDELEGKTVTIAGRMMFKRVMGKAELYDMIPEDYWKAVEVNEKIYGVPTYKDSSLSEYFVWDQDIADKYNIDVNSVTAWRRTSEESKAPAQAFYSVPTVFFRAGQRVWR